MTTLAQPGPPEEQDPAERTLETGLRRTPLSDEAYARIRSVVAAEWRDHVRPRRRPSLRWGALAASVAAALVVAAILLHPFTNKPVLGVVIRAASGDLAPGALVRAGEAMATHGPVLVELRGGGSLRIGSGTRLEALDANRVMLQAGELYVDLPPAVPRTDTFEVRTPLGRVEHLGTQFDVAVSQDVRIRVREGRILLRRGSETETAAAGTELLVSSTGPTSRRAIATHGPEWSWMESLQPPYSIENRSLTDFLQWAARETGRRVRFADDHARELAERIRLHGSISGMLPRQALETVFATTSLQYDLEDDLIKVSSGG
jgi:ferric-dicitrate binding protein FerR (iron transport regulator)